jgi:UDP-N-acetylmuramate dehydrogenase
MLNVEFLMLNSDLNLNSKFKIQNSTFLAAVPQGKLLLNAAMAGHTSWRAGGQVDRLYTPVDLADLCVYLKTLNPDDPVYFVGLGSNLLVRDGGVRGTMILLHGAMRNIYLEDSEAGVIFAEAGVASPKVARFAAMNNLVGTEFFAGIPGTVGGALAMNAGCYGHETWEFVTRVLMVDRAGNVYQRSPKDFHVAYRHVVLAPHLSPKGLANEWFVGAWFTCAAGNGAQSRLDIKRLLQKRIASQPLNLPNAGSVFRNPPGDYAARLIEACGMKGVTRGDAQVSLKHANFIVNLGSARASDIEDLIEQVQAQVNEKFGIKLQREVCIVGEKL